MAVGRKYSRERRLFGLKGIDIMLRCPVLCWVEGEGQILKVEYLMLKGLGQGMQ